MKMNTFFHQLEDFILARGMFTERVAPALLRMRKSLRNPPFVCSMRKINSVKTMQTRNLYQGLWTIFLHLVFLAR